MLLIHDIIPLMCGLSCESFSIWSRMRQCIWKHLDFQKDEQERKQCTPAHFPANPRISRVRAQPASARMGLSCSCCCNTTFYAHGYQSLLREAAGPTIPLRSVCSKANLYIAAHSLYVRLHLQSLIFAI